VLSGALALGAYEAGVIAQLGYAIGCYNRARPDEPPFLTVDLVSGASAGAITGLTLASQIMQGGEPEDFVERNWRMWCTPQSNLEELVVTEEGERSFLSTRKLYRLFLRGLHPVRRLPSLVRQDEVIFTCTLTSLTGIPYQHGAPDSKEAWAFATHRDFGLFSLGSQDTVELPAKRKRPHGKSCDSRRLITFALASSAFPGAWHPVTIERDAQSYPLPWGEHRQEIPLSYVDGGVLNNLPIDRATEALRSLRGSRSREKRIYLVVDPDSPQAQPTLPPTDNPEVTSVARVLSQVADAAREQSFYQDVLSSIKVNHRLDARDRLLPRLLRGYTLGLRPEELEKELRQARSELTELLAKQGSFSCADDLAERYERRFLEEERDLSAVEGLDSRQRRAMFLLACLVDRIADLGSKSRLFVHRLSPQTGQALAGSGLGSFGGLLHEGLRQHDFAVGVENCWEYLCEVARSEGWPEPSRARVVPGPLPTDKSILKGRSLQLVTRRAVEFLSLEMNLNPILREALLRTAPWLVDWMSRPKK
jgi:predicted acylesterase/phospholipase RssA